MRRIAAVIIISAVSVFGLSSPAEAGNLKVKARGGGGYAQYKDSTDRLKICDTRADGKPIRVHLRNGRKGDFKKVSGAGNCKVGKVRLRENVRFRVQVCKPRPGPNCTRWKRVRS